MPKIYDIDEKKIQIEAMWDAAQFQKQANTNGYIAPMVVALGNLESVRANMRGYYFDGPQVQTLRY